jgi:hypothetical protein
VAITPEEEEEEEEEEEKRNCCVDGSLIAELIEIRHV